MNEDSAGYLAGYWLGDGSSRKCSTFWTVSLHGTGEDLPRVLKALTREKLEIKRFEEKETSWSIFLGREGADYLASLGLRINQRSYGKSLPVDLRGNLFQSGLDRDWETRPRGFLLLKSLYL